MRVLNLVKMLFLTLLPKRKIKINVHNATFFYYAGNGRRLSVAPKMPTI